MSRQTNVQSVEALRKFRASLVEYAETLTDICASMHVEAQHTADWVQHDRTAYWPAQVRRSSDELAEAKSVLESKQLTINGRDRPPCTEEKQAVATARRRHRYTEEKVRQTKKIVPIVKHQTEEYRGALGRLTQLVETDLPAAIASLDRMISSLERYAEIRVSQSSPATPSSASDQQNETRDS